VDPVLINAYMGFTKKTLQNLLSFIQRDALIAVEGVRLYVRQKRFSIMEIRVEYRLHVAVGVAEKDYENEFKN